MAADGVPSEFTRERMLLVGLGDVLPSLADVVVNAAAGLLAAGSPCVIVLVPLTLFRFRGQDVGWPFVFFLVGFLLTYAVFALVATRLLVSSVQNGVRAGLGGVFSVTGMLCFTGFINPLDLPALTNPFAVGGLFALVVTLPFLGMVMSMYSGPRAFFSILSFAVGLITPAVMFVVFGKLSLSMFKKHAQTLNVINALTNFALVCTGVYLISQIKMFSTMDVITAGSILLVTVVALCATTFRWASWATAGTLVSTVCVPVFVYHILSHATDIHIEFEKAISAQKCPANEGGEDDGSSSCGACRYFSYMLIASVVLLCLHMYLLRFLNRDERAGKSSIDRPASSVDLYVYQLEHESRRKRILS